MTCQAFNLGLSGYAISAQHDIISQRYRNLDLCYGELAKVVGEEEALDITVEVYNKIVE
ncbi:MAG TPA: hypothetical protein VKR06_00395 [Ktedonosporobacter sp.]|nr:hypothetical protein [Ktedonosporobacter sp.]